MNKYNYDVNSIISIKDTNVPQFTTSAKEKEKDSLKFIENYDILLAQEKKQNELLEKKQQQQQNEELKQTATAMPQQIAAEVMIMINLEWLDNIDWLYYYNIESETNRTEDAGRPTSYNSDMRIKARGIVRSLNLCALDIRITAMMI